MPVKHHARWMRGRDAADVFAHSLARVAKAAPGAPELLVPSTSKTLFTPTEPFMTQAWMKLPVGQQRMEVLNVSDYETVGQALRDRSLSGPLSQAFEPAPLRFARRRFGVGHVNKGGPWMFDEPMLSDVRGLISGPFKPARAQILLDVIRDTCSVVLDEMLDHNRRVLDVGMYANEVHFRMMATIMGVDQSLAPVFRHWMRVFNESHSLAALTPQPEIRRRLGQLVSQAQRHQRQGGQAVGLLGELASARLGGATLGPSKMTTSDVISLLWAVIAAGTDTPGTAATATIFFTLQTGDFRSLTTTEHARAALAESLRFYPPFPKPLMKARRECSLGHTLIKRGQWVEVHLPAANRDQDVFSEPHEFNLNRSDAKRARPFGELPHYCIGSHYGQLVGSMVIATLAREVSDLALLAPPRPYRRHAGLLHRLDSLPALTNL